MRDAQVLRIVDRLHLQTFFRGGFRAYVVPFGLDLRDMQRAQQSSAVFNQVVAVIGLIPTVGGTSRNLCAVLPRYPCGLHHAGIFR